MRSEAREMNPKTLADLFLDELADVYDAEHRIANSLPEIARSALSGELRELVLTVVSESRLRAPQVSRIFGYFNRDVRRRTCQATVCLLEKTEEMAEIFHSSPASDAAIVCSLRKLKYHEIASYECLREWAELLVSPISIAIIDDVLYGLTATSLRLKLFARNSRQESPLLARDLTEGVRAQPLGPSGAFAAIFNGPIESQKTASGG